MFPDGLKFDEIGRWSEIKLEIIRAYTHIYTTVLSGKNKGLSFKQYYIDGFAGAGHHISKQSGEFVDGSPSIAVAVKPPFHEIHLIDQNSIRVSHLKSMFASDPRVIVHEGDCNIVLKKILPLVQFTKFCRGFCLLDPYGLHLNWDVMKLAGSLGTIDLILNFPVADMNRNVFWSNPSAVRMADIERMNAFWGDESWRKVVWKREKTLFDDTDDAFIFEKKISENEKIASAFQLRLKTEGGFKHVPDPIPMKNSIGATVYYLIFASNNDRGASIGSHIFKNVHKIEEKYGH